MYKVDFLHSQGLELGLLINQIMTTLFFTKFFFLVYSTLFKCRKDCISSFREESVDNDKREFF